MQGTFSQAATPEAQPAETQENSSDSASRSADCSADQFLAHYFRRIDPSVAASFTPSQRAALLKMFGHRGAAHHSVDIRWTVPLGVQRFYLVLLMGRDRRQPIDRRTGLRGTLEDWVAYLGLTLSALAALFALVLLIRN